MGFNYVQGDPPQVDWSGSLSPFAPFAPTDEEREEMRRLAESYDEEEHYRLIEAARPRQI